MVQGIPEIKIVDSEGFGFTIPDDENIWGVCVETNKGTPNEVTMVQSPSVALREFKVDLRPFWGVGGQGCKVVRVTAGTPSKASQTYVDTNTPTPTDLFTLTAKQPGTYDIIVSLAPHQTAGYNLTIREEFMPVEHYLGVETIEALVNRVNSDSQIVDAEWIDENEPAAEKTVEVVSSQKLGEEGSAGTNGTVDTGEGVQEANPGKLAEGDAAGAHATGLALLAQHDINGVFCLSEYPAVQNEYSYHADVMSRPEENKWRYAVIGADPTLTDKASLRSRANAYDNENVLFVGQGLIDKNGREYPPREATIAVAGKRSALWYGDAIWGGGTKKLLGRRNDNFFVDVMPLPGDPTKASLSTLNENGVITFVKDFDGVRIREGVTTVRPNSITGQSEEIVVSVVRHAKREMYKAAFDMLGKNITPSFKTDLEEHIKSALEKMKNEDNTLIDIPEEQLQAYEVSASIYPRENQREGKVEIEAAITPVHAARQIHANVVIL